MENLILKDVVDSLQTKKYVLPMIQREFVWTPDKISLLFDSILRGYPIGLFLFWELNDERRASYDYYSFQEHYIEGEKQGQIGLPLPQSSKFAILDGQQRLTSICLALKGTYKYVKNTNSDAVKRHFYMNLLYTADENAVENEIKYEFDFFADEELKNDENHYWYLVNDVLTNPIWKKENAANLVYEQICSKDYLDINTEETLVEQKEKVINTLNLLYNKICKDTEIIKYFVIPSCITDNEVLDVFVRVNSLGKQLSRTDFIFSRIVSVWQNARQLLDDFQQQKKVTDIEVFDKDLIMRICLAVVNKSTVSRLTTDKFNSSTIKNIKENWCKISNSIENTVDILIRLGYTKQTITSTNALIPIVCFLYNGGQWKDGNKEFPDLEDIRKYLAIITIKHIFSGQTLGRLNKILKTLCEYVPGKRPFECILEMPEFSVSEEDITKAVSTTKGNDTFSILTLLYKDKNYQDNKYEQDHMHPWALISKKSTYKKNNVSEDKMSEWKKKADTLPNLQILEKTENRNKSASMLKDWVKSRYKDENERNAYLKDAFLADISLEFADFEEFYEKRKQLLINTLTIQLGIK